MLELSVILPVHNEKATIETVIQEWNAELAMSLDCYNFVVCEDGSSDGTAELLTELCDAYPIVLNQRLGRRGYGRAVLDGIEVADSRWILCVDSDGQCDPGDFRRFWELRNEADVVIGWRQDRADTTQRKLFSRAFRAAFKAMFPTAIHDPSAPYVLFKKGRVAPNLRFLKFMKEGFWWGFVGMCVKTGLTVREQPIHHRARLAGDTQVYKLELIPSIAFRNLLGLVQLRFAR